MAESKRGHHAPIVEPEEDPVHNGLVLLSMLMGGIAIVAGMFWLASFLSEGSGGQASLITLSAAGGISILLGLAAKFLRPAPS